MIFFFVFVINTKIVLTYQTWYKISWSYLRKHVYQVRRILRKHSRVKCAIVIPESSTITTFIDRIVNNNICEENLEHFPSFQARICEFKHDSLQYSKWPVWLTAKIYDCHTRFHAISSCRYRTAFPHSISITKKKEHVYVYVSVPFVLHILSTEPFEQQQKKINLIIHLALECAHLFSE